MILILILFMVPIIIILALIIGFFKGGKQFKEMQVKNNKDIADKLTQDNKDKAEIKFREEVLKNMNNKS